jgi:hypothetical protein
MANELVQILAKEEAHRIIGGAPEQFKPRPSIYDIPGSLNHFIQNQDLYSPGLIMQYELQRGQSKDFPQTPVQKQSSGAGIVT